MKIKLPKKRRFGKRDHLVGEFDYTLYDVKESYNQAIEDIKKLNNINK